METMDIVIIVCIVIGSLAFVFIIFILLWAWRFDKKNRDAFKANRANKVENQETDQDVARMMEQGDASSYAPDSKLPSNHNLDINDDSMDTGSQIPYPRMIGTEEGNYPESVMSEDMNTTIEHTLQQQASGSLHGSSGHVLNNNRNAPSAGGSVSSMDVESYGYSLDGYAASIATPMPNDGGSSAPSNADEAAEQNGDANSSQDADQIKIRSSGTLETDSGDEEENGDIQLVMSKEY